MLALAFSLIAAVLVCVILVVAMCADVEPPPEKPKANPTFEFEKPAKKPIFQSDLEEASENVAFHMIQGGKPQLCFAMDNYVDDVPEPAPEAMGSAMPATYRSYVISSRKTGKPGTPVVLKNPDDESSYSYEEDEEESTSQEP